ncbi:MAG: hypothetical protein U1E83_07725 [Methylotetracoccus sp.]
MSSPIQLIRPFARLVFGLVLFLSMPFAAQAAVQPTCGPEIKNEIAKEIAAASKLSEEEQLKVQAALYDKYQFCAKDESPVINPFLVGARNCGARVGYTGSLYFEEMSCCGYDPQRRTFACPVKIKQPFGFGPAENPGSREYVLNCVADASGALQPVGLDSVHLADSQFVPSWQFAVVTNGHRNLDLIQPTNGQERRARSILSWNFVPTGCNYQPIWGNWLDYKIRLDE